MANKLKPENLLYIGVIIIICLLYKPIFTWLCISWLENPDYSHGFAIPLISGYIIWKKKDKLKNYPKNSSNAGLFVLLIGLLLQIASGRMKVNFLSAYSIILVLLGIIWYLWGKQVGKELLFPVAFLFFMVPFPKFLVDPISYQLKLFASFISCETVQFLGIPIYREGVIISVGRGTLEVANPCSGIRSLFTFLMMGTLFAYFAKGTIAKKLILFSFTIPLVIIGNAIRIIFAVLLLHFFGFFISNTDWEAVLGLIVVALITISLLFIGKLLKCQLTDLSAS